MVDSGYGDGSFEKIVGRYFTYFLQRQDPGP